MVPISAPCGYSPHSSGSDDSGFRPHQSSSSQVYPHNGKPVSSGCCNNSNRKSNSNPNGATGGNTAATGGEPWTDRVTVDSFYIDKISCVALILDKSSVVLRCVVLPYNRLCFLSFSIYIYFF